MGRQSRTQSRATSARNLALGLRMAEDEEEATAEEDEEDPPPPPSMEAAADEHRVNLLLRGFCNQEVIVCLCNTMCFQCRLSIRNETLRRTFSDRGLTPPPPANGGGGGGAGGMTTK